MFILLPAAAFGQLTGVSEINKPKLQISINESGEISLHAAKVGTDRLAAELSRRLKIPVVLSELMRGKTVNLKFDNLPLEAAARSLAPHARIDYVFTQKAGGAPVLRPLAIYLSGYNEEEPTAVPGADAESRTVVIEGSTETLNETMREESLKISWHDNRLTVLARRQNLSFVVSEIAARANLEFDLRYDTDHLIDVEIQNEPLAEALARLSPHVRVFLRRDLASEKITPYRVALTEAEDPFNISR